MVNNLYSLRNGFKKARKRKGITQAAVADKMGVTLKTVMNWEQGVSNPDLETTMKIAELFECDLDSLVGRLEERTHDLKTICELTGLSEAAAEKLQGWNHSGSMFKKPLSTLIESQYFDGLIAAFSAFLILCEDYSYLEEPKTPISFLQEIEDDKVVMPANEALYHYMHKAEMEMQNICELCIREEREKAK